MAWLNIFSPDESFLFSAGLVVRHLLKLIYAFIMIALAANGKYQGLVGTTATLIVLCFLALGGSYVWMWTKKFERADHLNVIKIFSAINIFVFVNSAVTSGLHVAPVDAASAVLVISIINGLYDFGVHMYDRAYVGTL